MEKKPDVYVVVMAGGGGTRFWPWSRESRPKQILPILSHRSMIGETVDRIRSFVPAEKIFIVTSRPHAAQLRRETLQIPLENFLVEPVGRNTGPCLCLAALHIQNRDPEAVMVALPADHFVADRRNFLRTLGTAVEFARRQPFLTTLGIRPEFPETGYGYVQKGETLTSIRGIPVFRAKAFREKPTLRRAKAYLRRGDYLWNSGMFIWKVNIFLGAVEKFLPRVRREMKGLEDVLGKAQENKVLDRVYSRCPSISVDYGIMEKADNVALIEAQFRWDDVGSWSALWSLKPKDRHWNAYISPEKDRRSRILAIDSSGCLVRGEEKLIALLGLRDMVVVEAGKAFLVCPRDRSQDVRRILEELKRKRWKEYL